MPNWAYVLREIQKETNDPSGDSAADKVRKKYLDQLHKHTGRNIICYYSGWLSKPRIEGVEINDEDKNGLMLTIHNLDRSKGLDLFIHTPGGSVAATESLVDYLRQMFGYDIRAIVPQLAMSAGTMIACSTKEILMGAHSNLGPVDPQINGFAAYAVIGEIERAFSDITANNLRALVWNPILSRYTPGFVQQCHWAIQRSRDMVKEFLKSNMLSDLPESEREIVAMRIVRRLTEESSDKGHDKHIPLSECQDIGLKVRVLENKSDKILQDLVLTIHHCFMFTLSNTPVFKIIENHMARRFIKVQGPQLQVMMPSWMPPPAAP